MRLLIACSEADTAVLRAAFTPSQSRLEAKPWYFEFALGLVLAVNRPA